MNRRVRDLALGMIGLTLVGCAAGPSPRTHYTLKDDPNARPLAQVVLLPVDVDVYELSAGGVREEVPEWSDSAEANIRSALLFTRGEEGAPWAAERVDTSELTPAEREVLEEHLALFNVVVLNAYWASLPQNSAWHFKQDHFDYTLGDGLSFLKTKYEVDAGLIIIGQDVVSTSGRHAMAVVAALGGYSIPLGHSLLIGGLVDFETGDILWLNREVSGGITDLRDPESARSFARELMEGYPGLAQRPTAEPEE